MVMTTLMNDWLGSRLKIPGLKVRNEGMYNVEDNAIHYMKHDTFTPTHRIYDTTCINNTIKTKVIR